MLLAFPLAVIAAFGGACAALGEIRGERDVATAIAVFIGLGVVSFLGGLWILVWVLTHRD